MNRVLIFDSDFIGEDLLRIKDQKRYNHLLEVLKISIADKIKICHVNHAIGPAIIREINESEIILNLLHLEKGSLPWCNLILGLSRPPTCKKILEHGTSLGVGNFHFFKAQLSEKSYLQSKLFQNENYREYLHLGLSQSGHYFKMPHFTLNKSQNFINKEYSDQSYILSPHAKETFMDQAIDFKKGITLAIGPERGWTEREIKTFKKANFKEIKISQSILRTEIATFSALGALETFKLKGE